MKFYIKGIGVTGPGLESWEVTCPILAGSRPYENREVTVVPPPSLPANERRRSVYTVRLAMGVATEAVTNAGADPATLATVFASSLGDGEVMNKMCLAITDPNRSVSPTIFHNSVHNAPAGYWHIATGTMNRSNSIAGLDHTFTAGLIEAVTTTLIEKVDTLFVAYDMVTPHPLCQGKTADHPFAVALVISANGDNKTMGATLAYNPQGHDAVVTTLPEPIESIRTGNPASLSLPLLHAIATGATSPVIIAAPAGRQILVTLDALAAKEKGTP